MFRLRRYRVFVAFALITLFALYKFSSSTSSWQGASTEAEHPKGQEEDADFALTWKPRPEVARETKKLDLEIPIAQTSQKSQTPPAIAPVSRPADPPAPATATKPPIIPTPVGPGAKHGDLETQPLAEESTTLASTSTYAPIHWKKQSERWPVPSASMLKLPTGKPKSIPKIQHEFKQESAAAKADREAKLNMIKEVFKRSWDGYREHAWLQDELSPVSGKSRNPFAGWGATLVDALDTLWIMGLKTEFEEAVKAVDHIDFTTTERQDIPLFETTIRYLGGFLAAYDLSDKKYDNLLKKAMELAEILISAFDTPNRMPQTYYFWKPSLAAQSHRASNRIVLAEIGSLSVEFTRLAQLTGEQKYYDAIARITDNLEDFQNGTSLPGMWPTYLDASGCKRIEYVSEVEPPIQAPLEGSSNDSPSEVENGPTTATEKLSPQGKKYKPLDLPPPIVLVAETDSATPSPTTLVEGEAGKGKIKNWDDDTEVGQLSKDKGSMKRRQLDETEASNDKEETTPASETSAPSASPTPERPECEDQGFVSYGSGEYTLGGMSDSTYEYLPKEWLLLGGQVKKYQTMYEKAIDVVKKHLIFRPMLPEMEDILFSGKYMVPLIYEPELEAENAHLTCFAGGMFSMGAKIYDRPEDLEIAKKLTEGCVWSYNMTSTGIMPEAFFTVPCKSTQHCEWNETKYWEVIDPGAEARLTSYKQQMETYEEQLASASAWYEAELAAMTAPPSPTAAETFEADATPTPRVGVEAELESGLEKRQLDVETEAGPEAETKSKSPTVLAQKAPSRNLMVEGEEEEAEGPPTRVQAISSEVPSPTLPSFPAVYSPKPPMDHEEYVKNRIQEERLPPGVTRIQARHYILRPEAIESVWYMYRITGDPHWREAGWRMFEAVNSHTATVHGNSAIDDVTRTSPDLKDEMESFWLAETLKYFYLLFAEENIISLDEWVLNTEAHPFRRPK